MSAPMTPADRLTELLRECFGEPLNVYRVNCRGASRGMTVGPMSYHPEEFASRLAPFLVARGVLVASPTAPDLRDALERIQELTAALNTIAHHAATATLARAALQERPTRLASVGGDEK